MVYTCKPKKVSIYINTKRKTPAQIKAETGCTALINGGLYTMSSFTPVCHLKADGKVLAKDPYKYWGFGWDTNELHMVSEYKAYQNYICCVCLVRDGKAEPLYYDSALGGLRPRTAIGVFEDGRVWMYADKATKTPGGLQNLALQAGVKHAIMLDGGGSTQGIAPTETVESSRIVHNYICVWDEEETPVNKNSRVLKTKGNEITSRFGKRTITYTSGPAKGQTVTKQHNGIDIVGTGSTLDDIVAHSAGTVQAAGFDSGCGYYVNILTDSGALMVYYHMAKGSLRVKTGDKVKQGQSLGYMGATGNVTGAHLHFGIKVNGEWIDPEPYINADYRGGKGDRATVKIELPVLQKGDTGDAVRSWQQFLVANGYDPKGIDSKFGSGCKAATIAYQKDRGLTPDGKVGPEVYGSMFPV